MASISSESISYTCVEGDTWDTVAYKMYKEERDTTILLKANPYLNDILVFEGGEVLTVPIIDRASSPSTLPPWRRL